MPNRAESGWRGKPASEQDPGAPRGPIGLTINREDLKVLVAEVVAALPNLDWPTGRLALTEAEAAAACGVPRHTLRDLRLAGRIQARKLGKRTLYLRGDLMAALEATALQ